MKLKKLVLGAAVSGTLIAAGPASAAITGVPGEALLVPLVFNSDPLVDNQIETYVSIVVPTTLGSDTVTDFYTAPNQTPGTQNVSAGDQIHWVLYDTESKYLANGFCDISLGDKVVWSTDVAGYQAVQAANDIINPNGLPTTSLCGPTDNTWGRVGYVLFTTVPSLQGAQANFAMTGDAWVLDNSVLGSRDGVASVPVLPLADGDDFVSPLQGIDGPPLNNVFIPGGVGNEVVITSTAEVFDAAPIAAGIRMNNGAGIGSATERVMINNDLRGPGSGSELSLHVYWFDRVASRQLSGWVVDDQQVSCSHSPPLDNELNVLLYNDQTTIAGGTPTSGWVTWNGNRVVNTNARYTDVVKALKNYQFTAGGYSSSAYCTPGFWNANVGLGYSGALNGYTFLHFREEGNDPTLTPYVDAAAVSFNWQEPGVAGNTVHQSPAVRQGWSSHLAEALGISATIPVAP
jgi:hypothetical protein